MMKQLAIFDLDGTLLNTLDDLAQACNHVLAARGYPTHAHEAYKLFVGDGIYKLVERCLPADARVNDALIRAVKAEFDAYYATHSEDLTAPYEGAVELLQKLKSDGMHLAVLSNKPHVFTAALCKKYFGDLLEVAHGQREGYPRKPDASLVSEILALTGIDAPQTVYIGDSGVDMRTAKNSGVYAIGALWGFRSREELLENGADTLAECPLQILDIIKKTLDK